MPLSRQRISIGKGKTKAIKAALDILTHILVYSGIFRHTLAYSGVIVIDKALCNPVILKIMTYSTQETYSDSWQNQNPGIFLTRDTSRILVYSEAKAYSELKLFLQ